MRADELMSSPVVTVTPGMSVKAAAALLVADNVTAAPVLDDAGELIGLVSETDLLAHRLPPDPRAHLRLLPDDPVPPPHRVRDVMTTDVLTVSAGADAADAVALMVERRVKSLPVMRDGQVVGMVSQRDLLRALARTDHDICGDVRQRLKEQLDAPGDLRVDVEDGVVTLGGPVGLHGPVAGLVHTVPGVLRVIWRDDPPGRSPERPDR